MFEMTQNSLRFFLIDFWFSISLHFEPHVCKKKKKFFFNFGRGLNPDPPPYIRPCLWLRHWHYYAGKTEVFFTLLRLKLSKTECSRAGICTRWTCCRGRSRSTTPICPPLPCTPCNCKVQHTF
jgi:hypothetical protein